MSEVKLACVSLTPLGVPVVPLVKRTEAMSPGATTTSVLEGAPSSAVSA